MARGRRTAKPEPSASAAPAAPGLRVWCDGCGYETVVTSRSRFGILEDLHSAVCDIEGLGHDGEPDAVLTLPPYAGDREDPSA